MSLFDDYLFATESLLKRLTSQHQRYTDLLTLQSRLKENIQDANLHGDTPELKANRSRVLGELNKLTLEITGKSFNEISSQQSRLNFQGVRHIIKTPPLINNSIEVQNSTHPSQSANDIPPEDIASNLGHPAWQGIGAIATIVLGIIAIAVSIVIALVEFKIIDIHSILP